VFSYQREYRIVVEPGTDGPLRFELGNLTDITSEVLPIQAADDVLRFGPEDAVEAGLRW
jgi:hypothetical protein